MKLLYFAPVDPGGLARYAVEQAAALARTGADVRFLGREHMRGQLQQAASDIPFEVLGTAFETTARTRLGRKLQKAGHIIRETRRQAEWINKYVQREQVDCLLISYYFEYFSPFWAGRFRRIQNRGVRIGTIVHDPVRDFQVGPRFWHRWSISQAYSFVDAAFQHDSGALDTGSPSRDISVHEIPHGLYEVESPATDESVRATTRSTLALPEDAYVLLSFGHIRDGKNLHLMLESLSADKNLYLLVVGREQSTTQKPVAWYQQQAQQLGVADRCRWINEFVPDSDVHKYFSAADAAVLLYSADFRSASGVLNNVAQFELPVLCSSGGGPLQGLIDRYNLGVWVKPDCLQAAKAGLQQLRQVNPAQQGWASYREDHSWDRNARLIRLALDTTPQTEIEKVGVS